MVPERPPAATRRSRLLQASALVILAVALIELLLPPALLGIPPQAERLFRGAALVMVASTLVALRALRQARPELAGALLLLSLPIGILGSAPVGFWDRAFILLPLVAPIVLAPLVAPPSTALALAALITVILFGAAQLYPAPPTLAQELAADRTVSISPTIGLAFLGIGLLATMLGRVLRDHVMTTERQAAALAEANAALARRQAEVETANADLRQLNQTLATAMEALEGASRTRETLISAVGHDLRSPIAVIIGYLDLLRLRLGPDIPAETRQMCDVMRRNATYLLALMDDMLSLSRLQAEGLRLAPARLALGPLLEEIVRPHSQAAQEKGLRLTLEVAEGTTLWGDPLRVEQVLTNLLSNAVKYTTAGAITLRAGPDTAQLTRIEIEDTGEGIPEAAWSQIFEPFAQTDRSQRRRDSTGLGLSIVKRLVEAHGGTIALRSSPEGTTFTLHWPTTEVDHDG